jgi:hypothetical protein
MSTLLQTAIPAAVTFLVGWQGVPPAPAGFRKSIRADMEMLDALPEGHPSRATGRSASGWSPRSARLPP